MARPEVFAFHNGRTARNAQDLLTILEEGPADLFTDHVTAEHNDFATWASIALQEPSLAHRFRAAKTREETIATLHEWLEPHRARLAAVSQHDHKDFMIGLAVGLIIGILVLAIVRMLA